MKNFNDYYSYPLFQQFNETLESDNIFATETNSMAMKRENMVKIFIPSGEGKEEIKERERIISEVYRKWYADNPSKAVFNHNLKDYIHIRFVSINETIHHASRSFLSTLAVLQLDLILRNAYQIGRPVKPKSGDRNQEDFSKIIIMECPLIGMGIAKLTVGVKKKTGMKIQYCITAIGI